LFQSFFPKPRVFFPSVAVWIAVAVALWYSYGKTLGVDLGFPEAAAGASPIIGLGYFTTPAFIWFYIYCGAFTATFTAFWAIYAPHKYLWWSVAGSALIVFLDYYNVQTSVVINYWQRPFWDAFQQALSGKPIPAGDFYHQISVFSQIAFVSVGVSVLTRFFTSHYVFRWRMAMNDYYVSRWPEVRSIEGAAQRVQEDTMRFAMIVEELGISLVDSLLTLLAFLPVLAALSGSVKTLPIVGVIPEPLVFAAILWSLFGTVLLAAAGMKLPNLAFRNQRVEAAYRKELVYG
jgi:peptide/bleomycin uptake transporter